MKLKKATLQTLSVVTTVGLALGVAAPASADEGGGAKDLYSDNTHNIAGGGVNIHADNTCVEKVGDTAHVKFEVQHQPLMRTAHNHDTAADGFIALPKSLKNVKIGIKAVADMAGVKNEDGDYVGDSIQRSAIYDTPVDMPVVDYEDDPEAPPMLGGSPGKYQTEDERARGYEDRGFSKKTEPDPNNPDRVLEHYVPTEQELRDHIKKFDVHMRKLTPNPSVDDYWEEGFYNGPFSNDTGSGMWYDNNITDYNIYEFGSLFFPTSFEIEADVVVEHDDTFVTGAVSNLGKRHSDEVSAGMDFGNGFALDEVLLGVDGWARPGFLPPAIPSDPKMIEIYKDNLTDAGLDISPRMVPTAEMSGDSKYLRIGTDIHPSARGDAGHNFYTRSKLIDHPAVTFIGQVPRSGEDGADITAAHVTLCPSEETPTTTKQLIPETETETPDKETETKTAPTTTKQLTPETETPEKETETEPTAETDKEEKTTTTPAPATTTSPNPGTETTTSPAPSPETTTTPVPKEGGKHNLANTGASVLGLVGVGIALIIGSAFLLRRSRRNS